MSDGPEIPVKPQAEIPFGWEPIASEADLSAAIRFSEGQRDLGQRVLISPNWRGEYDIYVKRLRCWPWSEIF